jgi:Alginate export
MRYLFCALSFAVSCMAQVATAPAAAKVAATPAPAAAKVLRYKGVTITGSLRSRLEAFDWFQPDTGNNNYAYSGNIFRISFAQRRESWDWNAEFAVPVLAGLPPDSIATGTQGALGIGANYFGANDRKRTAAMLFPKQLYIRINKFGNSTASSLRLGRFEFSDGAEITPKNAALAALKNSRIAQRMIGSFGWTDVGRSFDGAQYTYTKPGGTFTLVGATPTRGVFQVDGWGWNKTAFGYGSFSKGWGKGKHAADSRVFGIYYDDFRNFTSLLKTDNRSLALRRADTSNIKIGTFGGHSLHAFATKAGNVDLLLWGAAQTGKWGTLDQRSVAGDIEVGIQPTLAKKLKPWFRAGYYYGSGDNDPNDSKHGTFFQVLPTPRPFARFPFFNMMNNRDAFAMMTLRPHAKVTISNEFHALRLANKNDLWYQGGGVFQPWSFGYVGRNTSGRQSLANLYDVNVEYRHNAHFTFLGYYGLAQGLASTATIYPKGKNASFGYLEVLYKF